MKTPKGALFTIIGVSLLNSVGFGIVLPVMPQLIMDVANVEIADAAIWGGWLLLAYALMQFLFAPIIGSLSDRFGRRRLLLVSIATMALDYVILAYAPSLLWLFIARLVAGSAAATNSIVGAYIADISSEEERAQNFGLIGAAFGAGFVLGPAIGGLLGEFGPRVPFLVTAVLSGINFLCVLIFVKESLSTENRRSFDFVRASHVGALRRIGKVPMLTGIIAALFFYNMAHMVLPATWSYYTLEKFDWSPREIGYSLAFIGVLMVIVQAGLTKVAVEKLGVKQAAFVGMTFSLVAYVGYAFAPTGWVMYLAMFPGALAGLFSPAVQGIMTSLVGKNEYGELQGSVASLTALASIISPPIMTGLFSYFSRSEQHIYFPGAPFLLGAILVIIGMVLLWQALQKLKPES